MTIRRCILSLALVVAIVVACPLSVFGQLRGLGHVQGTVVDATGAPIPDVTVTATLAGASGTVTGTSDKKGEWKIVGIARGQWDVTFQKPGYVSTKAKIVLDVELARIQPLAIKMNPVP